MIPLKDDNPTRHFPILTVTLIAINAAIYLYQIFGVYNPMRFIFTYGAIPQKIFSSGIPISYTIFTSMFLHGGLFHVAGNMLYLWIFGNNIEDRLGIPRFIAFYLLCGIAAAYSHAILNADSPIPMVGASGAISGILGAYMVLFPRARVYTLIFLGFFIQIVRIPALIVIGFWIVIQLINGLISQGGSLGGVAWFAHIGGFFTGIVLIKIFLRPKNF
ncbi:MAG: rhomboid family intramembrane serine protease [Nitrospirota bacterium]